MIGRITADAGIGANPQLGWLMAMYWFNDVYLRHSAFLLCGFVAADSNGDQPLATTTLPQERWFIHSREPLNRPPQNAEDFGKSNSGPPGVVLVDQVLRQKAAQNFQRCGVLDFVLYKCRRCIAISHEWRSLLPGRCPARGGTGHTAGRSRLCGCGRPCVGTVTKCGAADHVFWRAGKAA